jgi:hypothetical protein
MVKLSKNLTQKIKDKQGEITDDEVGLVPRLIECR